MWRVVACCCVVLRVGWSGGGGGVSVCVVLSFFAEKQRCAYIQNAPVCTFETLPCLPSKRPCHVRHGRFDGTHGSVLKVHKGASRADCLSVCLSVYVSLCFSLFFFLSLLFLSRRSLFLSVSCRPSLSVLNDNDKEHSCSWLSLYTQL